MPKIRSAVALLGVGVAGVAGVAGGWLTWQTAEDLQSPPVVRGAVLNEDGGSVTDQGTPINYGDVIAVQLRQQRDFGEVTAAQAQQRLAQGKLDVVVRIPANLSRELVMESSTLPPVSLAVNSGASDFGQELAARGAEHPLARSVAAEVLLGLGTISPQRAADYAEGVDQSRQKILRASADAETMRAELDAVSARINAVAASLAALAPSSTVTALDRRERAQHPSSAEAAFWIDSASASLAELGRVWQSRLFAGDVTGQQRSELMSLFFSWQEAVDTRLDRAKDTIAAGGPSAPGAALTSTPSSVPGRGVLVAKTRSLARALNDQALQARRLRDALEQQANGLAESPLASGLAVPSLAVTDSGDGSRRGPEPAPILVAALVGLASAWVTWRAVGRR